VGSVRVLPYRKAKVHRPKGCRLVIRHETPAVVAQRAERETRLRLGSQVQLVKGPHGASNSKWIIVEITPTEGATLYGLAQKRHHSTVLTASLYGAGGDSAYQIIRRWKEPRVPKPEGTETEKREWSPREQPPAGGYIKVHNRFTLIK
jgi:hypothetical protein